jgi:hypothetical protein
MVHDDSWFLLPKSEAQAMYKTCLAELSRSPAWMPELPVDVEGHLGEAYETKRRRSSKSRFRSRNMDQAE